MEPLNPSYWPFLSIILMIPAMPSGSYFAEGDVITSTWSIRDAGILSKKKAWWHWCKYGKNENRRHREIITIYN